MITEGYVSFETAKLLKEKGFDGKCYKVWVCYTSSTPMLWAAPAFVEGETIVDRESVESAERTWNTIYCDSENKNHGYLAPSLQMAMKWLREDNKFKKKFREYKWTEASRVPHCRMISNKLFPEVTEETGYVGVNIVRI